MPAEDLAKIRAASNSAVFTQAFAPRIPDAIILKPQTAGKAPSWHFWPWLRGLVAPRGVDRPACGPAEAKSQSSKIA